MMQAARYKQLPEEALRKIFDHHRWLSSGGKAGQRLEESELDLRECDLDGVDFSQAKLIDVDFTHASLKQAKFIDADLREANFITCVVEGADFTRANLEEAAFIETDHKAARSFQGANMAKIVWSDEDLFGPAEPQP